MSVLHVFCRCSSSCDTRPVVNVVSESEGQALNIRFISVTSAVLVGRKTNKLVEKLSDTTHRGTL